MSDHDNHIFVRKNTPKRERISEEKLPMMERQWRENKALDKSRRAREKAARWKYDTIKMWDVSRENWNRAFGYAYQLGNERYDMEWNLVQVRKHGKWVKI